ncbi:hypothetical protein BD769DRAFT_1668995 [Suillus cothurnatus]|nr:hypothetical protein BD769DRAFT_1668995 [Suillus cothurnatus]
MACRKHSDLIVSSDSSVSLHISTSSASKKAFKIDSHEEFLAAAHCLALQLCDAVENGELSEDKDAQLAPSLKPLIGDPQKASELNTIIKKMDATISATCSDSTSHLKSQIGHCAAFNTKDHPVRLAIYNGSDLWTHLGNKHPVLAHFLCPVRELGRFSEDANKALRENQCGKVNSTTFALPAFLWAGDPLGQDYDNDDVFEGIFVSD